ncbi:MAG TPA: EAL domain-containing protein [Actinomycetota bacterium]|jgi:diguanylate cyclase (GGDEF)-like protein/PAS domain S-box-containing protein
MSTRPERAHIRALATGWGWLALLRLGLLVAMAIYTATYRALPTHPAPAFVRPAAIAVMAFLAVLVGVQVAPRFRDSRQVAIACFAGDAMAVLGTLALYSFDPRRYLLALQVVVQAEGGMLLGLPGGIYAWAATSAGYAAVEAAAASASNTSANVVEVTLRIAVGLLLALGGGILSSELSGERSRRQIEREQELRRLQVAEAKYRLLVEQIPVVTYIDAVDPDSSTIYMSPQVEDLLGYSAEEWMADPKMWEKVLHPEDRERVMAEHVRTNATGEPFRDEYRLIAKDGRVVWVRDEASLVADDKDGERFWQGVIVDITERKRAEEQVAFLAYHDKLTGLPNRVMFERVLDLALARARRNDQAVAVLYLDLDNFKLVNDSLGHAAGDELLREMGTRLSGAVRATDVVARQGGDEFLVLLADMEKDPREGGMSGLTLAQSVASRIHEALKKPFALSGTEFYITTSIGISLFPESAGDARALLKQADAAMYRTKQGSPGGSMVYASERTDSLSKLSLTTRLRKATDSRDWVLHYQPIVDLHNQQMVAAEALLRWRQPSGRLVGPADFIPLAEEMGLIAAIGDWVIEELCRQCLAWREQRVPVDVSFNLSARQLWQQDVVARLLAQVSAMGVEPSHLVIEIAESTAMRDPERTQRVLHELHEQGFRLAIDDFGTGYSSVARLKNLPVDILKIDGRFVRDIPSDPDAASMVRAVIGLAQSLAMKPLAEGIESEEQLRYLLDHGCALGQGFHFSPPVPADELTRRVREEGLRVSAAR